MSTEAENVKDTAVGRAKQAAGDLIDNEGLKKEGEHQETAADKREKAEEAAEEAQDAAQEAQAHEQAAQNA